MIELQSVKLTSHLFSLFSKRLLPNEKCITPSDISKFKITRNPANDIKTKLSKIILENNNSRKMLPLIEGDYKLGYECGNVKTHKLGHPLRPILSQTRSVT